MGARSSRKIHLSCPDGTPLVLGGGDFSVIAGPCSIESATMMDALVPTLREMGVAVLRGGIHKLRTQPDRFQGHGREIYDLALHIKKQFNLPLIAEITDVRLIDELSEIVDLFQVGSRNMYQYPLLTELGKTKKPVLIKRAFSATIDEWLGAARYVEKEGNRDILLCERGIRGFEPRLRNTLDLASVALLKQETDYPIFVDPSHATGRRDLVVPLALAAQAVGADGILVEVHPDPDHALSDGPQSLDLGLFRELMNRIQLTTRSKRLHKA